MAILHSLIDLMILTIVLLVYRDFKKGDKKNVVIDGRFDELN